MEYPSAKHVYNHMVGRTASAISPFYSLLHGDNNSQVLITQGLFCFKRGPGVRGKVQQLCNNNGKIGKM